MNDPERFKVDVKYRLGHTITHTYEKDEKMFCPNCGEQHVYSELGGGDYYVGERYVCIVCNSSWTIQGPGEANYTSKQIIDKIKKGTRDMTRKAKTKAKRRAKRHTFDIPAGTKLGIFLTSDGGNELGMQSYGEGVTSLDLAIFVERVQKRLEVDLIAETVVRRLVAEEMAQHMLDIGAQEDLPEQ